MIWTESGLNIRLLRGQAARALLFGAMALACLPAALAAEKPASGAETEAPDASGVVYRMTEKYMGDIGPDSKRRGIRVLVHYSRTKFFVASGRLRGYEHDLMKEFETHYNRKKKRGETHIPVVFIPVRFDELIPLLLEGRGDVAAGFITVTGERARQVTFTLPYLRNVSEVIVSNADAPAVSSLDDLSGRKVHVLRGSSFVLSLKEVNRRLANESKPPVQVVEMPPSASTEDLLEMVNAGIFEYTAADDYLGNLWAGALRKLRVEPVRLSEGNRIAWAVRPGSSKLLAALNDFIDEGRDKLPKQAAEMHARYLRNLNYLGNNLDPSLIGRKKTLTPYFQSASKRHEFDWLFMMAQGFQESRLDQAARSHAGAVGVMQVLPTTGKEMGYRDVETTAKANIDAGVKYMRFLMDRFFNEPELPFEVRLDFALASYNAGPTRIQRMRRIAAERGLDPNQWFHHVERVTLEKVGEEPVRYVANIHSYYTAYKLSSALDVEAEALHKPAKPQATKPKKQ
jgi:membrane-bound lytic murein transglycosylase MltF